MGMLKAVVARVPRTMMTATSAKFAELERQLKAKAGSIEDVDQQRKWVLLFSMQAMCGGGVPEWQHTACAVLHVWYADEALPESPLLIFHWQPPIWG